MMTSAGLDGEAGISELEELVERLPEEERRRFKRIFHVSVTTGRLVAPASMHDWIRRLFGSLEVTENQRVIKVTNLVTFEGALFNELRSRRPIDTQDSVDLRREIEKNEGDPLCHPEQATPADVFGRVYGEHCVTASNVAKYDGFNSVIVFDEHNPLSFSREAVIDYIDTGLRWAKKALEADPEAKYFLFMWNCLWKAGGSLLHGHAQGVLTRDMHYARIEMLRRAALDYRARHGTSYFDDLYLAHEALGCAFSRGGVRVLAYLTPIKEKETLLLAPTLDAALKERIYETLTCFRQELGVSSFNLALYLPPLAETPEDWSDFPVVARVVDRGDPLNRTSDIGAMELYASSVIATDPFAVARLLNASPDGSRPAPSGGLG